MGAAISYCSPQQVLTTAVCGDDGSGPDYMHLPCPVKYEEIAREAYSKSSCLPPMLKWPLYTVDVLQTSCKMFIIAGGIIESMFKFWDYIMEL